jgi:uncharacterized protein YfaS (alpha-2-macroglobulin family)
VESKLAALIEARGDAGPQTVKWLVEELAQADSDDPEELAALALETRDLGERVREGSPEMAQPASQALAEAAVAGQAALTLEDFLD